MRRKFMERILHVLMNGLLVLWRCIVLREAFLGFFILKVINSDSEVGMYSLRSNGAIDCLFSMNSHLKTQGP